MTLSISILDTQDSNSCISLTLFYMQIPANMTHWAPWGACYVCRRKWRLKPLELTKKHPEGLPTDTAKADHNPRCTHVLNQTPLCSLTTHMLRKVYRASFLSPVKLVGFRHKQSWDWDQGLIYWEFLFLNKCWKSQCSNVPKIVSKTWRF